MACSSLPSSSSAPRSRPSPTLATLHPWNSPKPSATSSSNTWKRALRSSDRRLDSGSRRPESAFQRKGGTAGLRRTRRIALELAKTLFPGGSENANGVARADLLGVGVAIALTQLGLQGRHVPKVAESSQRWLDPSIEI